MTTLTIRYVFVLLFAKNKATTALEKINYFSRGVHVGDVCCGKEEAHERCTWCAYGVHVDMQKAHGFFVVCGNKGFDGIGNFGLWWKRVGDI